ncbi:hypothetical protein CGCSCA4_v007057 [Colletotrichum siamense]|uniref:Uncharacterized protein n=1 Tax=Colletotrichum siamense TaxID=690259 RepID=A0A9P5ETP3_COLSI|nr:hypothetical protein CGCSCA4_v007057 [Colletotrichum siamense]KAF4859740.1 hypothetical protein CGCSCA2_v005883 [Colletotrichum siamense]
MPSPPSAVGSVVFAADDAVDVDVAVAKLSFKDADSTLDVEGKIGTVLKVEGTEAGANEVVGPVAESLFWTEGNSAPGDMEGVELGAAGLMKDAPRASLLSELEAGANDVDKLSAGPPFWADDAPAEIERVWSGPVGLMNDAPSSSVFSELEAGSDDVDELVAGPLFGGEGDDAPADTDGIELGVVGLMKDAPRASLSGKLDADAVPVFPEAEILPMLDEPGVL